LRFDELYTIMVSVIVCRNGLGAVFREGDIDNGKKGTGNQGTLYFIITYTIVTLPSNTYSNQGAVYPCIHRIFR